MGLQLPVVVVVEALDLPLPAFVVRGQRCRWPRGRARTTAGAPSAQRGHLVLRWGHRPALNFLGGNLCPTSGGHLPSSRSPDNFLVSLWTRSILFASSYWNFVFLPCRFTKFCTTCHYSRSKNFVSFILFNATFLSPKNSNFKKSVGYCHHSPGSHFVVDKKCTQTCPLP